MNLWCVVSAVKTHPSHPFHSWSGTWVCWWVWWKRCGYCWRRTDCSHPPPRRWWCCHCSCHSHHREPCCSCSHLPPARRSHNCQLITTWLQHSSMLSGYHTTFWIHLPAWASSQKINCFISSCKKRFTYKCSRQSANRSCQTMVVPIHWKVTCIARYRVFKTIQVDNLFDKSTRNCLCHTITGK